MMMYRKSQQRVHMNRGDLKLQRRVLLIVCALLLTAVIILTVGVIRNSVFRTNAVSEIHNRMYITYRSAYDVVSRMNSGVISTSLASQAAMAQQYVYYMEQLNDLNGTLCGSRLVSQDLFTVLKNDLSSLEALTLQATTSTQDVRNQLFNHLAALGTALNDVLNIESPR